MRSLGQCFIFFFLLQVGNSIWANSTVLNEEEGISESYLDSYYNARQTDSIFYYLDLSIGSAQEEENYDVWVDALIQKGIELERIQQGDSSAHYFRQAISVAAGNQLSSKIKAKLHHEYGFHLSKKNEFVLALHHLDTAQSLYLSIPDSASFGDVLSRIGAVHDNFGNLNKALSYYLEAIEVYRNIKDSAVYAGQFNNVAIIYKKMGDFDDALKYYNYSIELLEKLDNQHSTAISVLNRAMLYKDINRFDEALSDMHQSLSTFKKEKFVYGVAISHHNLAEIHLKMKNIDSVLYHIDQSQELSIELQYWIITVGNQLVLSKTLRSMGRPDISNKSALRAYELAKEHGLNERMEELTALISTNYEDLGDHQKALQFFKEHKQLRDSIFSEKSQTDINRLRAEYDLKQKEENIRGLETINNYQRSLAEKEHKISQFLTYGIFLSFMVVALFFYLYRRQKDLSMVLSEQKTQLTGLNKEKDDLIAMVAHDLRSPLNNIKGLLALIKEANGAEQEKMVELANESTDVLRSRINQILDVEAINVGKINLKIEKINVSDVLNKLVHHITPEAEQKNISFYAHSVKDLTCMADENYLLQVLENLCANAIKFSKQKSEIYVKVSSQKDKLRFEVQDQGQGIPKKEMKRLFERYAKISTLPTDNEKSTGLGLPIVKKYVEAMGGKVWCESEVGEGSTFFFELPAK